TPTAALGLRSLLAHGFRPVLATGRSADDVRDRCRAWGLSGGVAEYGAVTYGTDRDELHIAPLTPAGNDALRRLREVLDDDPDVDLDPCHRASVRASRRGDGVARGLTSEQTHRALAASRAEGELVV